MKGHPEIDVVSRDRGEDYAAAARKGAPQARQVADRFHLTQNLTDLVEEILARCRVEIRKVWEPPTSSYPAQQAGGGAEQTSTLPDWHAAPDSHAGSAHLARHAERSDRYQHLVELRAQGLTYQDIARRLGMGERTVRRLPHTRDSLWETRASPQTTPWI